MYIFPIKKEKKNKKKLEIFIQYDITTKDILTGNDYLSGNIGLPGHILGYASVIAVILAYPRLGDDKRVILNAHRA